jgi:hypothetical protein
LIAAQDNAVKDSLAQLEMTGENLITDGEQRASSFATYPITDTLGGTGLADTLNPAGQYVSPTHPRISYEEYVTNYH